jgi:hypothetical protein
VKLPTKAFMIETIADTGVATRPETDEYDEGSIEKGFALEWRTALPPENEGLIEIAELP